jgi:hypothetical protein
VKLLHLFFLCHRHSVAGTYIVLPISDIDLIFGMWVYNDQLQIKLAFRSGPMIFGRAMALELWNLAKYLVVTTFFAMLRDIDLTFCMRVYNHKLQTNVEIQSGWIIFCKLTAVGLWNLAKYLVVPTFFYYDLRYWLDFWYVSV